MKVLSVVGTRPEAIKMAPVVRGLAEAPGIESRLCATGQHREMLDRALADFELTADYDLAVMKPGQSLTDVTAGVLQGMERVLAEYRPDWVLVQGDTATTMAAALAAFYAKIKVGHIEAGLRSFDRFQPWPEEINRKLTSVIAELHLAPTETSKANLVKEGVEPADILVTGNTVIDALIWMRDRIEGDAALSQAFERDFGMLKPEKRLILVTGHRRENFDGGLDRVCHALRRLAERGDVELLYAVHLNPNVQKPVNDILGSHPAVHLVPPQDYRRFIYLMNRAYLIVTDSGGIQEEAPSLGKPVLVTRETTERPEAVEAGTVQLVGTDTETIVRRATELLDDAARYKAMAYAHNPYGDGQAVKRILERLLG